MYVELLAILAGYGLANAVVNEEIFKDIRMWILQSDYEWLKDPFACMRCMSFWSGSLCGLLLLGFSLNIIVVGLCTHAFTVLLDRFDNEDD